MMDKKWAIVSIIAVVIVATVALGFKLKKDNDSSKDKETNTGRQEEILSDTGVSTEDEDCLTVIQQEDASGREYSVADVEKMEINIVKMKQEVKDSIFNMAAFKFAIQEYFYTVGIMETEVTCLNQITYDYNDNYVIYHMYVNSHVVTHFEVIYDIASDSYKVLL